MKVVVDYIKKHKEFFIGALIGIAVLVLVDDLLNKLLVYGFVLTIFYVAFEKGRKWKSK